MHRHHAAFRKQIVERGEHRLLHLAGIGGAADQHDHAAEVDGDHRFRMRAVPRRIGAERRQVDDRHVRHEAGEIGSFGADQEVADEQRVPGVLGHDPHRQTMRGVGAADQILDEEVPVRRMRQKVGMERIEGCRRHRLVVVPPDGRRGPVVADDELVLGRAPGVLAGIGDERAVCSEPRFAAADRFLVEVGGGQIIMDSGGRLQPEPVDPERGIADSGFTHQIPRLCLAASIPGIAPRSVSF